MSTKILRMIVGFLFAALLVACSGSPDPVSQPEATVTTVTEEEVTVTEEEAATDEETATEEEPATDGEPIRIGISGVLSGPVASIGQDYEEATKLAVQEINDNGGVLGRPLELYFADNQCDPAVGVNAVGRLIDVDNVSAIIGSSCSSVTLAVMPVVERAGIVQLTAGSTAPQITQDAGVGGNIWQFRLNIDDSIMAEAFSRVIAEENESVVIVGSNDDYGRGAADAFEQHLEELGVTITSIEFYTRGQTDYRPMITSIRSDDPDGMVVIADAPDAAPLAVQMAEVGFTDVNIYGRGTVVTPEFLELTGDPTIWNGAKEVNRWAPTGSDFEVAYEEMWGRVPRVTAALPYYGIYTLAAAIEDAGSADRAAIRDSLEQIEIDFPDLGPVVFDDHHQAHPDMFILQWQDGEIVLLERRSTQ